MNQPSASTLSAEQLYDLFATDILRFSYYYLGDRQKAEDVTQDVFVKLITHQPVLEPGKEKAWLLKVALNRCRDIWRSSWVRRVVNPEVVAPSCVAGEGTGSRTKIVEPIMCPVMSMVRVRKSRSCPAVIRRCAL